jgi:hypothetical protein
MDDFGVTGATVRVEVLVGLEVEEVWRGITAVERYGEWSPECTYGAWVGAAGPVEGARFAARNRFPDGLRTEVVCLVTVAEEPFRFGWDVFGGEDVPFAHWEYELKPAGDRTLICQSFTHGPGHSGMRQGVMANPGRAEETKQRRLNRLGRNMEMTIEAMTRAIREPGR